MNPLTKCVVILSTLLAAAVEARASSLGFAPMLTVSLGGFAVACLAGAFVPNLVARSVLAVVYLTPAAFLVWSGADHYSNEIAWIAPLLGLMLSGRDAWRWHVPAPWRWPLVAWALIVAISWPIVALREMDFAPWIRSQPYVSNTSIGIAPEESITWVAYIALGHLAGLLWMDHLCRAFSRDTLRTFRSTVLYPLAAAAVVACLVGAYQGFVSITTLSGHVWPHMNRAAGTLMDANAFGMIVALWAPAFLAMAAGGGLAGGAAAAAAMLLAFVGVWTSGSRTALAALVVGLIGVAQHAVHLWRTRTRQWSMLARLAPVLAGAALAAALVAALATRSSTTTVFQRGAQFIPGMGDDTRVGDALFQLWDRFGYGTAAWAIIKEHPLVGIGVGSFNTLVHDYSVWVNHFPIPPDNAQSWFRHHLAELGVLGSLPWILWSAWILRAIVRPRRRDGDLAAMRVLRGPLVALGLVSLLGMPAQSVAVIVTVWTLVFWYLTAAGELDRTPVAESVAQPAAWRWAAIGLLVAAQAGGTFAAGREGLRPPHRAVRFGWDYHYGLYDAEADADGGVGRRWVMKESAAVIPVGGRVLKLACWNDHPVTAPLEVRVWVGDRLAIDTTLGKGESTKADVPVAAGAERVLVRTWVNRAFSPADFGVHDTRQLGLAMSDWNWEK